MIMIMIMIMIFIIIKLMQLRPEMTLYSENDQK
jgi:hypothetical protein